LVKKTYNFKPSRLSDSERNAKSDEMDKVWSAVKADPKVMAPCLRESVEDPQADAWFRIDGSSLLVEADSTPASKALKAKYWNKADPEDISPEIWVETLTELGSEGFDVSEGGRRWLEYPNARYFLAAHGGFKVDGVIGAMFIFGSMDESQATPALTEIVNQRGHPKREAALWILVSQATPESLAVLKRVDTVGFSKKVRDSLNALLTHPDLIEPRSNPELTREDFLRVFQGAKNMDLSKERQLEDVVNRDEREIARLHDKSEEEFSRALEKKGQQ
jgi:hypothetical protein